MASTKTTISSPVDKEITMKIFGIRMACIMMLCLGLLCGSMPALAQKAADPAPAANAAKINLNSATAEQLASLPGIGAATAKLIIEHRTSVGKFSRVEELLNVKGIGDKKFEAIKDMLTI